VPRSLDDIADRLLGDPPRHHAVAINSAAGLSAALSGVIGSSHEPPSQMSDETVVARQNGSIDDATVVVPPIQLPPALDPSPPPVTRAASNGRVEPTTAYMPSADARPVRRQAPPGNGHNGNGRRKPPADEPRQRGGWGGRILILLAILALLSVIAMAQFLVKGAINKDQGSRTNPQTTPRTSASSPPPPSMKVNIADAKDFDPPPDGNGEEHPAEVPNTYDGNPSTTWTTMSYKKRADLGGQKKGVGIIYDLGTLTDVSQVTVSLIGDGTNLELRVPKVDPSQSASTVDGWKAVATLDNAPSSAVLKTTAPVKTRYVLVWLTSLPKESSGNGYRGEISEVSVQR
jgi:hypothetical protein